MAYAGVAIAALGGAFWLGRATVPQPAVQLKQDTAIAKAGSSATDQHAAAGPVDTDRKRTVYGPTRPPRIAAASPGASEQPIPCPVAEVIEEHEHRGPVVTDTHQIEQHAEATRTHLDLTVTPQVPNRAIYGGVRYDGTTKPEIGGDVRIFGSPAWLVGRVEPLELVKLNVRGSVGLRWEF